MSGLFSQLSRSLRKPEFWAYSSWLDIVTRYRRTRLGLLWLLAPVLLFTFVTGPLYSRLFGRDLAFYLVHLGMGFAIWRMLSMVLSEAINSLRSRNGSTSSSSVESERVTHCCCSSILACGKEFES